MKAETRRLWFSFGVSLAVNTLAIAAVSRFWNPPVTPAPPDLQAVRILKYTPPPAPKTPRPTPHKARPPVTPHPPPRPAKPIRRATLAAPAKQPHPRRMPAARAQAGARAGSAAPVVAARPTTPVQAVPATTPTPLKVARAPVAPTPPASGTALAPPTPAPPVSGGGSGQGAGAASGSGADSGSGTGIGAGSGSGPFGLGIGSGEGPRHIVYLLDVSPSMESRIDRAEQEVRDAMAGLQPGESFDLIAFGGAARAFDSALVPASRQAVRQADYFLGTLQFIPGTNLEAALTRALDMPGVNVVCVLTDGVPTQGETNFKKLARLVQERNTSHARIYTIGLVGKNPDGTDDSFEAAQLLQQIADDSGGQFKLVPLGVATPD